MLDRYRAFGMKVSGGDGDNRCGAWVADQMNKLGYTVVQQSFEVPWFDANRAVIVCDGVSAPVLVHTGGGIAVKGTLALILPGISEPDVDGRIALIQLPYGRWSSDDDPRIAQPIARAFAKGAVGVVLITQGPTGEAIALNTAAPISGAGPVAILAPNAAAPFLAALGSPADLIIEGTGGERAAFNVIARLERGHATDLLISTPRSGWLECAGERGPGLAIWLLLAEWLAGANLGVNLVFFCSTGHERGHAGVTQFIANGAPAAEHTALWLHLGANCATRDWHEANGQLAPLPSADPQRFLMVSKQHLAAAGQIFSGLAGLEHPYPVTNNLGGELADIAAAGYPSIAGIFGAHRLHHTAIDDGRSVSPELALAVFERCRNLIERIIAIPPASDDLDVRA